MTKIENKPMGDLPQKIEVFYSQFKSGEYDHPVDLARALQALSDDGWEKLKEVYQSSLIIPG